ncbi:MAG: hypothetical protein FJY07_05930 [Bacteroidetes bacterium]|nr:hypothetical protein [Bacteroidota bacterium]
MLQVRNILKLNSSRLWRELFSFSYTALFTSLIFANLFSGGIVQSFVRKNKRIRLVFLPPYSPNLNIIERLWKFFKKNVTYNTYYERFAVFREYCLRFFKNLGKYRDELETLMTDNFQLIQV